ncbi:unnamed protein product [Vitrella brassicaformis CCMP3155]|uniref:Uncharacterized protein n=1 Tax=Vitrella brassicaformis (strain CCMP3155) TaxID=1169540 RepID=A0A0G4FMN7_VITBC|nr:unnamed protein product [Vitrella brassicaformis CCMP3155]|eukprot:CEM15492.1 unnamed protein product [Vitrella brassicaformis CCMP3155]
MYKTSVEEAKWIEVWGPPLHPVPLKPEDQRYIRYDDSPFVMKTSVSKYKFYRPFQCVRHLKLFLSGTGVPSDIEIVGFEAADDEGDIENVFGDTGKSEANPFVVRVLVLRPRGGPVRVIRTPMYSS